MLRVERGYEGLLKRKIEGKKVKDDRKEAEGRDIMAKDEERCGSDGKGREYQVRVMTKKVVKAMHA